jgi:7,8-dihydroneopterin aldolase/epimerase/oxygenase
MKIKIKDLTCETIVGVYASEKKVNQPLVINVSIDYNEGESPRTDRIADTLNYHKVVDKISAHVRGTKFDLLEKVVEDIGNIVLSFERVKGCKVEVDKPNAPIEGLRSISVSKKFRQN